MPGVDDATAQPETSPLLTRREAAAICRVSLRTFERFVQPNLPAVAIGARVFFATYDVKRWLDTRRSPSSLAAPPTFTARRAPSPNGGALSQQESEILGQLRARRIGGPSGAQRNNKGLETCRK
jgi:hypothetical protein